MTADAIDRAIEDAARAMTAGEPSPAFRVQVIDRLGERRSVWHSPWLLSPIAVAAVVLLGVALRTPLPQRDDRGLLPARTVAFTASVPAPPATPFRPMPVPPSGAAPLASLSAVAALAPPQLEVSSLSLSAIAPGESLEIPELETIAPITVTPIGDPQGESR